MRIVPRVARAASRRAAAIQAGFVVKEERAVDNPVTVHVVVVMGFIAVMVVVFAGAAIVMASVSVSTPRVSVGENGE